MKAKEQARIYYHEHKESIAKQKKSIVTWFPVVFILVGMIYENLKNVFGWWGLLWILPTWIIYWIYLKQINKK